VRPKIGQKIKFKLTGSHDVKEGIVKFIESPRFQKHLQRTQYEIESEGKLFYVTSNELVGYAK
jgi:hypothetical protein